MAEQAIYSTLGPEILVWTALSRKPTLRDGKWDFKGHACSDNVSRDEILPPNVGNTGHKLCETERPGLACGHPAPKSPQ